MNILKFHKNLIAKKVEFKDNKMIVILDDDISVTNLIKII